MSEPRWLDEEEKAATWVSENMSTPVFSYIAGFSAPPGKAMGHAGAIISGSSGTAQAKKDALEAVGIKVGTTPTEVAELVVAQQPQSIIDAVVGTKIGSRVAIAIPVKDLVGDQGAPQAGLEPDADMVLVFDMIEEGEAPPAPVECKDAGRLTDEPEVVQPTDDPSDGFDGAVGMRVQDRTSTDGLLSTIVGGVTGYFFGG